MSHFSTKRWTKVCSFGNLKVLKKKKIGPAIVLYVKEAIYAIDFRCAHKKKSLEECKILDSNEPSIICPWHLKTINLITGELKTKEKLVQKIYPVTIRDDYVYVDFSSVREQIEEREKSK